MKRAGLIFSILLLTGCVTTSVKNEGNGYDITHEPGKGGGVVNIEYRPPSLIVEDRKKRAQVAMTEPNLKHIPKGGMFIIKIEDITIDAANTENFLYIVKKGDQEILRQEGEWDVPEVPSRVGSGRWWNTDIVFVKDAIEPPFDLYVVHKIREKRDKFTVSAPIK